MSSNPDFVTIFSRREVLAYYAFVNVVSGSLVFWDKFQSRRLGWRVAESTLCWVALAGGGAAGGVACLLARHKTAKISFQLPFCVSTIVHVFLARWMLSP